MPSTYAHYKMGQAVREALGGKEREIVESYPELFLIGLHGPDILFYYKPLSKNIVNQTGFGMHDRPGKEFFDGAVQAVREQKNPEAYLAYMYGFICHFALDVACHGYIAEKMEASGLSHAEVEVEFDRELMVRDGLDPVRQKLTNHIIPSEQNAKVIQAFFKNISVEQVRKALKGIILFNNILLSPSKVKRGIILTVLKWAGKYDSMHGLMISYEKNPVCDDSTEKLMRLYENGRENAEKLIPEFTKVVETGAPLAEIYRYTFGSELITEE